MKSLLITLLLAAVTLLGACVSKSKVSSAEFGRYISGFTSGKVDLDEEIRIELTQAVLDSAKIDRSDTAFLEKNVRISPSVDGKFYWKNEKTIAFRPESKFREGREYHVAFRLSKFMKVPSDFKTFDFFFETDKLKFEVSERSLISYDEYNIEWQQYEMLVRTNIELDTAQVRACFSAKSNGKTLPAKCYMEAAKQYRIIVDSIPRTERAGSLTVSWNTKALGGDIKDRKEIPVTSLGSYKVTKMEVRDDGDQKLDITFSDPILPNQNFDGLIEVQDAPKPQISVSGNMVTVFFSERLEGNKQVKVVKGLLNFRGYKMDSTTTGTVLFAGPRPALRLESKGCILPNSQGLLFPFESIGIHTVDVRIIKIKEQNIHQFLQVNELDGRDELTRVGKIAVEKTIRIVADTLTPQNQWSTHILDLGKLIQPEPGSLYRVCIRFKKAYTYLPCRGTADQQSSGYTYDVEDGEEEDEEWNEFGWHGEGFDGYDTWSADGQDPCDNYYYQGGAICKNILASDIGVVYQEEKNRTARIVTTNLLNAGPLAHTEVALYAYTQEKIASGITDAQGFLQVSLKEKPFLLVARNGKQRAYLKLTNSNCLSTSRFDVEGTDQANGLKGFLYAERGVWRPGDSVYLNFVLNDKSNPLPEKHPIAFELNDPDGKLLFKKTVTENKGHIYPLYFQTSSNAPMGTYTAKVTVGNAEFTQDILLEYIVPNRMKLLSNVDNQLLTPRDSLIDLRVSWLNGATGKGLKTQASVHLRAAPYFFKKYEDYTFVAPYNEDFRGTFELKEAATNDSGLAHFRHPGMRVPNAPGMMQVSYTFKAFEQGGGFSIDQSQSTLSVFDSYTGIKVPKGTQYSGSLDYSKSYPFGYVVVNKNQEKVGGHHLQLKIYEISYSRWYEADDYDVASFRTHVSKICIRDTQWIAAKGEGSFRFGDIGKKTGRYMIVLKDLASGHETGAVVTFDDPYWDRYSSDEGDNEGIIQLSASKKSYKVGEKVQLTIPAAANAHILMSVESDAKVLQQFWVAGDAVHKPIEFTVTSEMAPGIYVHAMVLQPHHYTKDGSPIRQYGILPLQIEDPNLRLIPVIGMKDEIKPETQASLSIAEQNGKAMNYSLVLVDEGLLDLTHFKTPDIWEEMNAQRSLKIKTWDLFNQVIGAYSGKIQNVFAIGGDGSYDESEDSKANRFKPAVINLGTFHLDAGRKMQHSFTIPNYCGRMKAFVVAYNDGKSGSASREFYVRKPLMLLTGAPRTMSAAEKYRIPVTVFNTDKKARKVNVTMTVSSRTGFTYSHTQAITFRSDGDAVVNFDLAAPEEAGILQMEVTVSDGAERSSETIEIALKPTQPVINHRQVITVEPGAKALLDIMPKGVKGTYQHTIILSDNVHMDFENRLRYLIEYPHGCVEQTTSSAFAQLFLNDISDISDADAALIKTHVESVIHRLNQYQTHTGGFSYWPYQYDVNEYASIYVLHFLSEAQRKGFEVSRYMLDNAISYQKEKAKAYEKSGDNPYQDQELEQAYRLYLLADMSIPDLTAMNKFKESEPKADLAKALLAKAYRLTGKSEAAQQLARGISGRVSDKAGTGFSSSLRDRSMMLIALQHSGNNLIGQQLANEIGADLAKGWNSTLATSMGLVALSKYYSLSAPASRQFSLNGQAGSLRKHSQKLSCKAGNGKVQFVNTSGQRMYLVLNEYYSSTDTRIPLVNNGMRLQIDYLNMSNGPVKETELGHGSNFKARIQVTNTTTEVMENIALDYYIANGWQVISNRYSDDQANSSSASFDFRNIKDDRMNIFFGLQPKETKVFYVTLNASYMGHFFLPLAQCYPMYNEQYKAQIAGKWVNVQ